MLNTLLIESALIHKKKKKQSSINVHIEAFSAAKSADE